MFVLRAGGIKPMLTGSLSFKDDSDGIYVEVREENIPKKYRIESLGGMGTQNEKYFRSNMSGITHGRYFEKIAEPLDFEPIQKNKLDLINDKSIKYDWEKVSKILEATDNNSIYRLSFSILFEDNDLDDNDLDERKFILIAKRILEEEEIKVKEHEFKEFESNFRGMYCFGVYIPFITLSREEMNEIKQQFAKRTKTNEITRRIEVDLDTLKAIVEKYNLKIHKALFHNGANFFKERTYNFTGKDTEGIDVYKKLNDVMTFSEASEKWGLGESTLRSVIRTNKLIEGVDYRKSGKVWLITKEAMQRLYDDPRE